MKRLRFIAIAIFLLTALIACGSSKLGDIQVCSHIPAISNLRYTPISATLNEGDGSIIVSGSLDYVDDGGDISTLKIKIWDSGGTLLIDESNEITGVSGVPNATIIFQAVIDTTIEENYSFEITAVDSQGCTSNKITGQFPVVNNLPSGAGITFSSGDMMFEIGGAAAQYDQYISIFVKDQNGLPISNEELTITYPWAVPSDTLVQFYDGGVAVNSPLTVMTDGNGAYTLHFKYWGGTGYEYSGNISVSSSSAFGSVKFEVGMPAA